MQKNALTCAMVEPVGGHGGMDYYDFSLCESLALHGIEPILLTCDKTDSVHVTFEVWKVYQRIFGGDALWRRGLRFLRGSSCGMTRARMRTARIAHFHFFHVGPLELFNALLARLLGMKVVATAHDVESFKPGRSSNFLIKRTYALASAVIAHNQISRSELIEKLSIPPQRIHVIRSGNYEGYSQPDLTRKDACRAIGVDSSEFVVIFFGQIKEVKGLDVLIRAIPSVIERSGVPVRLVIAGKVWKDSLAKYQALIDELGLKEYVKLDIRYIPDIELAHFYRAADIMVLPYRRIYQSAVVLMAMTFGTPVLVSDIPGMLEVVTHDENGLVFKSGDHVDLAEKLLYAANNPKKLTAYTDKARELMRSQYSWNGIGMQTADLYRKLLCS